MFDRLFRPRRQQGIDDLYAQVVAQARQPEFYRELGVADRIDARFELYTLHVLLVFMRLNAEGEEGSARAQALFNTYVSALDHTLRELGVGDISVGKKMRKLGESLFGRMSRYEPLLADRDGAGLAAALARNVYESEDADRARPLAEYALRSQTALAAQSFQDVFKTPDWPEVTP